MLKIGILTNSIIFSPMKTGIYLRRLKDTSLKAPSYLLVLRFVGQPGSIFIIVSLHLQSANISFTKRADMT